MTLDFNHRPNFAEVLNGIPDAALVEENASRPRREYPGDPTRPCLRAGPSSSSPVPPSDDGADFPGRTLRIFAIGHALRTSPSAGFVRPTISPPGRAMIRTASSSASRWRADASAPRRWNHRRCSRVTEARRSRAVGMQDDEREELARDGKVRCCHRQAYLRGPDRPLPGLKMDAGIPGSRKTRHCSPPSTRTPLNFTTSWCRSSPSWARVMSGSRSVRIRATDAASFAAPRARARPLRVPCAYTNRCWSLAQRTDHRRYACHRRRPAARAGSPPAR